MRGATAPRLDFLWCVLGKTLTSFLLLKEDYLNVKSVVNFLYMFWFVQDYPYFDMLIVLIVVDLIL